MNSKYHIKENGFDEIKKKVLSFTIPIIIIAALVGLAIPYFNRGANISKINILPFVIPVVVVFQVYSIG